MEARFFPKSPEVRYFCSETRQYTLRPDLPLQFIQLFRYEMCDDSTRSRNNNLHGLNIKHRKGAKQRARDEMGKEYISWYRLWQESNDGLIHRSV